MKKYVVARKLNNIKNISSGDKVLLIKSANSGIIIVRGGTVVAEAERTVGDFDEIFGLIGDKGVYGKVRLSAKDGYFIEVGCFGLLSAINGFIASETSRGGRFAERAVDDSDSKRNIVINGMRRKMSVITLMGEDGRALMISEV